MITSKFYLIRGDNVPIYVGFTNREVELRFSEHKKRKDFSIYKNITIEEIDRVQYEFTWDYVTLNENAKNVSRRENELIYIFGTQDSPYQKADGGGSVWTHEKWFVRNNPNNPLYEGIPDDIIESYIQMYKEEKLKVFNYISKTVTNKEEKTSSYITKTQYIDSIQILSYIRISKGSNSDKFIHYISGTVTDKQAKLHTYFLNTRMKNSKKISGYITKTVPCNKYYLTSYINHSRQTCQIKYDNYIKHTLTHSKVY